MRGIRKLGVAAVALAVGVLGAGNSQALVDDPFTSYTQPANALVMPFDQSDDHSTFFIVSNLSGLSPAGAGDIAGVTTHWSYWSEDCSHLADVYVCLTLNDTVIVDPADVSAIDAGNNPIGPKINLSGNRGFVVVTAYETDEICSDASVRNYRPVDNAIVGTYTFASISEGFSFGNDAIGLGLDDSGSFTQLPGGNFRLDFFDYNTFSIQTFNPESIDVSAVVLLSLKEQSGSGSTSSIEIGPNAANTVADLVYYDNLEIPTSLPEAGIRCAKFTSLIPGLNTCTGSGEACETNADCGGKVCVSALIPGSISLLSSGILRLDRFSPAIGGDTGRFIYGLHGQAIDKFGGSSNMKYKVTDLLLFD